MLWIRKANGDAIDVSRAAEVYVYNRLVLAAYAFGDSEGGQATTRIDECETPEAAFALRDRIVDALHPKIDLRAEAAAPPPRRGQGPDDDIPF